MFHLITKKFYLQIDSSFKIRFISNGSTVSAELPSFSAPSSTAVTTVSPKLPQRLTLLCLNGIELSISSQAVTAQCTWLLSSWQAGSNGFGGNGNQIGDFWSTVVIRRRDSVVPVKIGIAAVCLRIKRYGVSFNFIVWKFVELS